MRSSERQHREQDGGRPVSGRPGSGAGDPRGKPAFRLGIALLLLLGVGLIAGSAALSDDDERLRAELEHGIKGTFTVESCVTSRPPGCNGTFRADSGGTVVAAKMLDAPSEPGGDEGDPPFRAVLPDPSSEYVLRDNDATRAEIAADAWFALGPGAAGVSTILLVLVGLLWRDLENRTRAVTMAALGLSVAVFFFGGLLGLGI